MTDARILLALDLACLGLTFVFFWSTVIVLIGLLCRARIHPKAKKNLRFAILICARNEERVIRLPVRSVLMSRYPANCREVIVLADNCADATVERARNAGATVWEKTTPSSGKGDVLAWGIEKVRAMGGFDAIAVFDADNIVDPHFISAMDAAFTQDYDVPLAQHKNYKYFWNHKLIGKLLKDKSPITPSWYNEKTTGEITGPDAMKYKWIKPNDKVPDGWCVLTNEGKPGVESFRSGITTVQMIKRSGNKRNLEKSAASDYTMETPKETFGKTGSWLRGGSKIRKSGKRWELTVSYLNSKYYDKDLY